MPPARSDNTRARSEALLLEAGRALLACQELEAAVQQLFAGLAVLRVGRLTPRYARAILNGTSKLSVGKIYTSLRPHIKPNKAWVATVERAIAARNRLIHGFFRKGLAHLADEEGSGTVLTEAAALRHEVRAGYLAVREVVAEIGSVVRGVLAKSGARHVTSGT